MSGADLSTLGKFDKMTDLLQLAQVAEGAERYEDMCQFMSKLVTLKKDTKETLTVDERNLLSVAYKNVVGTKRAAWRTLNADEIEANEKEKKMYQDYKLIVEQELDTICSEVLDLIQEKLLPVVEGQGDEEEVFYLKMCGDYYRYLAEIISDTDK